MKNSQGLSIRPTGTGEGWTPSDDERSYASIASMLATMEAELENPLPPPRSSEPPPQRTEHTRSSNPKRTATEHFFHYINTASREELLLLKGVKDIGASKIIEFRPFENFEDMYEHGVTLTTKQAEKLMLDSVKEGIPFCD